MEQTAHSRNTPTLAGPDSSGAMLKPSLLKETDTFQSLCVSLCVGGDKRENVRGLYGCESVRDCVCMHEREHEKSGVCVCARMR